MNSSAAMVAGPKLPGARLLLVKECIAAKIVPEVFLANVVNE
jgi:hypothetical protein